MSRLRGDASCKTHRDLDLSPELRSAGYPEPLIDALNDTVKQYVDLYPCTFCFKTNRVIKAAVCYLCMQTEKTTRYDYTMLEYSKLFGCTQNAIHKLYKQLTALDGRKEQPKPSCPRLLFWKR